MVIFIVITQNRIISLYYYLHVCSILHQTFIHRTQMYSFSSQKWYTDFKSHFWFTSTECSVLVPSGCLPWICDHQWYLYRGSVILVQKISDTCTEDQWYFYRGCEASAAVVLWNDKPASWVAVHGNREEWPPERCCYLFEDFLWSSIYWEANEWSERIILGFTHFVCSGSATEGYIVNVPESGRK